MPPPFYAVMGEDDSDAEALAILIRRLRRHFGRPPIKVKKRGFNNCAQLLRKGAAQLAAWETAGCFRAVIAHDADTAATKTIRLRIQREVIKKSKVTIPCCALVPTREIEAWFIADIEKFGELFDWCRQLKQPSEPELFKNPKEFLNEKSKHPKTGHYHFNPVTCNPFLADRVDLDRVKARCPSFAELFAFVKKAHDETSGSS